MSDKAVSVVPQDIRLNLLAARGCDWCGDASDGTMLAVGFKMESSGYTWTEYWHTRCWVHWAKGHPEVTR